MGLFLNIATAIGLGVIFIALVVGLAISMSILREWKNNKHINRRF